MTLAERVAVLRAKRREFDQARERERALQVALAGGAGDPFELEGARAAVWAAYDTLTRLRDALETGPEEAAKDG